MSADDGDRFRRRAASFGEDAEQYERSRPTYPATVVDGLLADVGGGPVDVLDIGCGTGKLGRLFAQRRCAVTGVEPDARMARVARRFGLQVEVSPFERWSARGRTFALAVAGQSWHWVDPLLGPPHLADVLAPGGVFGALWNVGGPVGPVAAALDAVNDRHQVGPGRRGGTPRSTVDVEDEVAAPLRATGRFLEPEVRSVPWSVTSTRDEWLDQVHTHSEVRILPPDRLAALLHDLAAVIDAHGGSLSLSMRTDVIVARRR